MISFVHLIVIIRYNSAVVFYTDFNFRQRLATFWAGEKSPIVNWPYIFRDSQQDKDVRR